MTDGSDTVDGYITYNVAGVNDTPTITSYNGEAGPVLLNIDENTTAVTTVTATDPDNGDSITYSIDPGVGDATKFAVEPSTGALSFVNAPDYDNPTDVGLPGPRRPRQYL